VTICKAKKKNVDAKLRVSSLLFGPAAILGGRYLNNLDYMGMLLGGVVKIWCRRKCYNLDYTDPLLKKNRPCGARSAPEAHSFSSPRALPHLRKFARRRWLKSEPAVRRPILTIRWPASVGLLHRGRVPLVSHKSHVLRKHERLEGHIIFY
jgi:hypothetical protein